MWHLADTVQNNDAGHITQIEQPEAEDGDQFLSFAKRSKVVQRQCSEMVTEPSPPPQSSSLSKSREDFWHRILCQPSEVSPEPTTSYSPFQMQMLSNKPEGLVGVNMTGSPPAGQRVKKGGRLGLRKLPSPAELMGRKKKGRTGSAAQGSQVVQPRVAAVLQHIGDLRRRQSSIDQLKRGNWWGSKPRCKAEEGRSQWPAEDSSMSQAQLEPSLAFSTTVEKQDEATDYLSPTLTRPYTQQEGMFGGFEQASHLAPGGNPMMSFVLATADRQAKGGWQGTCLSHNEFWGIGHTPEE
ncbi:hypothetical protein J4Q44_G00243130 [Coregonus suidteri]|uniref:Uncharacterized protein n=1 Tax=Coregonus suidteri TaxID=861788 RepID=A0AAN8L6E3_9TELE